MWFQWNSSLCYILFLEKKRLQTMLWHHNARVNSHQRWKQMRFSVCFLLWCELTSTMNDKFHGIMILYTVAVSMLQGRLYRGVYQFWWTTMNLHIIRYQSYQNSQWASPSNIQFLIANDSAFRLSSCVLRERSDWYQTINIHQSYWKGNTVLINSHRIASTIK